MTTLITTTALAIVFIVSLIILIMTTEAAPRIRRAMKRESLAVLLLGTLVLSTGCLTTQSGRSTKSYSSGKTSGYVKRAIFATAIKDHEPVNKIRELRNDQQKIYYFTDLRDMQGQKVTHRWIYKDKVMAEVAFKVKGPRWRVYSSKRLARGWLGDWTVLTVDRHGRTLSRNRFSYAPAGSKDGYLDKGFRKVGELYDKVFGED
jgi:hypothetical protein